MTAAERAEATRRLKELEREELLPKETIRDLKVWWQEKQRELGAKIIPFPTRCTQ